MPADFSQDRRRDIQAHLSPQVGLAVTRHGVMAYMKADRFIGAALETYGESSEIENAIYNEFIKPGSVVVEAGANIGSHTVLLSQLAGPTGAVLAFEPQRIIHQMLCANLALNGALNVVTYNMGVGRARSVLNVPPVDYTTNFNPGGVPLGTNAGEPVDICTLDDYGLAQVDFLKVDVEGMEQDVLEGARQTIARARPVIYTENSGDEKSEPLIRMVMAMGYRLWWHWPRLYNPDNFNGVQDNIFSTFASINMLCLPAEAAAPRSDLMEIVDPAQDWKSAETAWLATLNR